MANLVKWVATTQAAYAALATKDAYTLYWLEDTKEIYKGATSYTEAVVFYDTTLPAVGAAGKMYIENTTLQGSVWTGSAWKTVIEPVSQSVMDGGSATTKAVSGAAVKAYVEAQASTISAQAVTDMSWDATSKAVKFTKNGVETSVPLTLLADQMSYDGATGKLTLKDHAGTVLSEANLPLDNFVQSGSYDDTLNALVLTLTQGGTVTIPASDLVKIYHAGETGTAKVTLADLATVTYVDGIRDALNLALVAKTDIVAKLADVNTTTPSEAKVISERVLVEALSWTTV